MLTMCVSFTGPSVVILELLLLFLKLLVCVYIHSQELSHSDIRAKFQYGDAHILIGLNWQIYLINILVVS